MQMYQHRVLNEKTDLDDRLGKLEGFVGCTVFHGLPEAEQARLCLQLSLMCQLSAVLAERIAAF